ncbi:MAG: hypothetical protein HY331_09605, partial [Chloroflexi bacterium]|nr:hypothetical protein [Chloroflexota bacterium]
MSLTQMLGLGFILLALMLALSRVRGRLTLTIRMRGRAHMRQTIPSTCPHLGTDDDPFRHGDRPSDTHRCYLGMQRDRIDLAHQRMFCLGRSHVSCPWLSVVPGATRPSLPQRTADWVLPQLAALADTAWRLTCTTGWPSGRAAAVALGRQTGLSSARAARATGTTAARLARRSAAWSRRTAPLVAAGVARAGVGCWSRGRGFWFLVSGFWLGVYKRVGRRSRPSPRLAGGPSPRLASLVDPLPRTGEGTEGGETPAVGPAAAAPVVPPLPSAAAPVVPPLPQTGEGPG